MNFQSTKAVSTERFAIGEENDTSSDVTAEMIEMRWNGIDASAEIHVVRKPKDSIAKLNERTNVEATSLSSRT